MPAMPDAWNVETSLSMNSTAGMAIDHPTLSTVVADSLRQLIAAGKLAPGSQLNERELCDRLKVSRTPLREAYRILSAEGLAGRLAQKVDGDAPGPRATAGRKKISRPAKPPTAGGTA